MTHRFAAFDAGGILFEEDYWYTKLRRRYRRLKVGPGTPPLTESQFLNLSEALSVVTQTEPTAKMGKLLRTVFSAYEVPYLPAPHAQLGVLRPGVVSVLQHLQARDVSIAVLSDAPYSGAELEHRFGKQFRSDAGNNLVDYYISSMDIGATKPARIVYEALLHKTGWNREETIIIAHDLDEMIGACVAGFSVAAVNVHADDAMLAKEFCAFYLEDLDQLIELF